MRQYRVGIGHARLEPLPVRPLGVVVAFGQPPRRRPGHVFQRFDVFCPLAPQMPVSQDHIGLGTQAAQVGERGQNRFDQLAGQRPVAVGQVAAEHFRQGANRLALAITAAFGIEPTPVVTEEIVESPADATREFKEAQVGGHPLQHLLCRGADSRDERRGARPGRCRRSCSRSRAGGG